MKNKNNSHRAQYAIILRFSLVYPLTTDSDTVLSVSLSSMFRLVCCGVDEYLGDGGGDVMVVLLAIGSISENEFWILLSVPGFYKCKK